MDELEAMQKVKETLEALGEKDTQKRVLTWTWSKFIGGDTPNTEHSKNKSSRSGQNWKRGGSTSARRQLYDQVKSLNLKPAGKTSLQDFVASKNPANNIQKVTVAVYYLKEVVDEEAVSINHVYTCFKWMKWKQPRDLKNTIHQAGAQGLMDTKKGDDLRLTAMGENLVEHELGTSAAA